MPRPGINIMIMRQGEPNTPVRSYSIPGYVPRLAVLLAAFVLFVLVLLASLFLYYYNEAHEVGRLRAEVSAANASIQKLESLQKELNYHREFTRRIAGLLGISVPSFADSVLADARLTPPAGAEPLPDEPAMESSDPEFTLPGVLVSESAPDPNNRPRGLPLRGRISRGFAPLHSNPSLRHTGIDLAAREGTPVLATADGVVEFAGEHAVYGLQIIIDHGAGFKTSYGHNSLLLVRTGESIRRGDQIAFSGNTGLSTAPHLHYEITKDGQSIDPAGFLGM